MHPINCAHATSGTGPFWGYVVDIQFDVEGIQIGAIGTFYANFLHLVRH